MSRRALRVGDKVRVTRNTRSRYDRPIPAGTTGVVVTAVERLPGRVYVRIDGGFDRFLLVADLARLTKKDQIAALTAKVAAHEKTIAALKANAEKARLVLVAIEATE